MIRNLSLSLAIAASLVCGSVCRAESFEPIPPEILALYSQFLTQAFEREATDRQVKFEVDAGQAIGFHNDGDGMIAVPIKGLKEGKIDPAVETDNGAGLCYLFLSPCYAPQINGKPIEKEKLRRMKLTDNEGRERETIAVLLTVKHVGGDEWRLYGFGADKSPVLKPQFDAASGGGDKPLQMKAKSAGDKKTTLEFTVFGKYAASFEVGAK